MLVCTLGDLLLDVIVRASGPLAPGADTPVATRLATGGQAANVASWVVALGEEARFVGKLADDPAGELARSLLERRGVEVAGPLAEGASGVVVAFVGPDGERSMATDRGVAPELRADELESAWLACDRLHISGYGLLADPIGEAALAAARLAREAGAAVSVDLSSWSTIREFGPERFRARLEELAPDLVFANEPEWELVGGAYGLAETAVVKGGARGGVGGSRRRGRSGDDRRARRRGRGRVERGRARAVRGRRPGCAQGGAARPRRLHRPACARRDHRRRHARRLPTRRDPLHGHRRDRRRPPRLRGPARCLGRPRRARADARARRRGRRQVPARRAGYRRGARDARRPDARLPHRRATALLRCRRRAARLGAGRVSARGRTHRRSPLAARRRRAPARTPARQRHRR